MKKLLCMLLIAALAVAMTTASAEDFLSTVAWDAEYDVVVAGFGIAGASSALTAAQDGADVLIVEKAPKTEAGGNSIACMQYVCISTDVDATVNYMKSLRGSFSTPSDTMIETYAVEAAKNLDWLKTLGAPNPVIIEGHAEYPEMTGSSSLPYFTVDGTPGGNGAAYKLVASKVEAMDNVDIWYEAPAVHLIQDPATKIVHGVSVSVDGKTVNVRAKNGVILATGGYECNAEMLENYANEPKAYSLGHAVYNTGDGIVMAQEVGAKLWHMGHIVGHIDFIDEQTLYAPFRLAPKAANAGAIFVGGDATRFMNETYAYHHGKYYFSGSWITLPHPETMWMIFDENVMNAGPLFGSFSEDNSAEIEKGWITVGDSVADLAAKIGLDAETLANTIDEYNVLCENGEDIYFGRDAKYLLSIKTEGKLYAMPLFQSLVNTMGGPERNENGEIIGLDNNPIPHLYEAGELGDIWSNGYQAGCNFGGGMIFGRISGHNAAAVKTDVTQDSVMNGRENYVPENTGDFESSIICGANQYWGKGTGHGTTPLYVRITLNSGAIADIEILQHSETAGIADAALEQIPAAIVAANSVEVDGITGATMTSDAIREAVSNALSTVAEVAVDEREKVQGN